MRRPAIVLAGLRALPILLLALLLPDTAAAQTTLGAQFQVNELTTGPQESPAVAMRPSGSFVVVWQSELAGGAATGILGRRFDADGTALGVEFQADVPVSLGRRFRPDVAIFDDGGFVVVWMDVSPGDGDRGGVFARRYDAAGSELGGELQLAAGTADEQLNPSVATRPDGAFVVAFADDDGQGDDLGSRSISVRRVDSTGVPLGADLQINAYTTGPQDFPRIASFPDGELVVAWESAQDGDQESVHARRVSAFGGPLATEIQVNGSTSGRQRLGSVATDPGGRFVVSFQDEGGADGSVTGVLTQTFERDGTPVGGEQVVPNVTTGNQSAPAVRSSGSGDFLVLWRGNTAADPNGIAARPLDSLGIPLGADLAVNGYTTGNVLGVDLASDGKGTFVAVWGSVGSPGDDGSSFSIQARFLDTDSGAPVSWEVPADLTSATQVLADGAGVEAINGSSASGDPVVNGVPFTSTDDLLPGSSAADPLAGATTGDADLDVLLGSFDRGDGPDALLSIGAGALVPGRRYVVQVFYTDLRTDRTDRLLDVADDRGHVASLLAGGTGPARGGSTYGQVVTGSFTATGAAQPLALTAVNFNTVNLTAYQVREAPLFTDDFESEDTSAWDDAVGAR